MSLLPFRIYVNALRGSLDLGNATEHTHRPALKGLLETLDITIGAVNEPRRIECGAPDLVVTKKGPDHPTIGYIEAKDIGRDLKVIERDSNRRAPNSTDGQQLQRYRQSLSNLVLTDYVEFRRYADGELVQTARLAADTAGGLTFDPKGAQAVHELLAAFFLQAPEPVASAEELAVRMARITHMIRDVVAHGFEQERISRNLRGLYEELQKTLNPGLNPDTFADMFAQTLAYGLFAARVDFQGPGPFRWQDAAHHIPRTNRFIRPLFNLVTGPDLNDEPFVSFVDDLAQLLGVAEMEAVLADFGRHGVRQDPIMNFYETFLAAYDPTERERRGVYYTPEPVISYIVRSVDHLLRERFDCTDGLADYRKARYADSQGDVKESHRVLVLDPACGTGSFLYAVIQHIREHYQASGQAGLWTGYVKEHLLPRLFGFELLMAAYAMAHLKLGMQLAALDLPESSRAAWAYSFEGDERLGVYLTNALEPVEAEPEPLFGLGDALANEASAAADVKRDLPIMVVLGNPPYSGHSANKGEWITGLIDSYKQGFPELRRPAQAKWLSDDYVKFIRFAQWRIEKSGSGVLAFVTNHSYLDNSTFRGMRRSLLGTYDEIYLLDLHGNSKKKERAPGGGKDDNVFDIQQGVAIGLFVKHKHGDGSSARVLHADLWGERQEGPDGGKYGWLAANSVASTQWTELSPKPPSYLFIPRDEELLAEYEAGWSVADIFSPNGDPAPGIVTTHDQFAISWTAKEAQSKVERFLATPNEEEARKIWRLCSQDQWSYERAKEELQDGSWRDRIEPVLYRPFDIRYTVSDRNVAVHRRERVMGHMLAGENLGLVLMRQVALDGGYSHFLVTRSIVDNRAFYSSKGIMRLAPLYLYSSREETERRVNIRDERRPNLDSRFTATLQELLGLTFIGDCPGDLQSTFGPEDVFHYIYAITHSPKYRDRYDQFLRADFPRVPLPDSLRRFRGLVALGQELSTVHLLEAPGLIGGQLRFPMTGENVVEPGHPKYVAPGKTPMREREPLTHGRVYLGRSTQARGDRPAQQGQYFEGIEPEVWEFTIGGYQPMEKWLKDRKGRTLGFEDLTHYGRMASAIRETIRLMGEIDRVGLPIS